MGRIEGEQRQALHVAEELVRAAYGAPEARLLRGPEGAEAARLLLVAQGWTTSLELATSAPDVILARIRSAFATCTCEDRSAAERWSPT